MIQPADKSPDLTVLERLVLETAFSSTGTAAVYRQQIDAATVAVRTPSGVGFMTRLHVPVEYRAVDAAADNVIPVVIGEHPLLLSGAEFIVQIKDGRINCIEAFCYEGMWPNDESRFTVHPGRTHSSH